MKLAFGIAAVIGALAVSPCISPPAFAQTAAPAETPRGSPNGPFSSNVSPGAISPDKSHRLNVNSATEAQLAALPGVGGTLAKAIVAGRPYRDAGDLEKRQIVPENVYSSIKDLVF